MDITKILREETDLLFFRRRWNQKEFEDFVSKNAKVVIVGGESFEDFLYTGIHSLLKVFIYREFGFAIAKKSVKDVERFIRLILVENMNFLYELYQQLT